MENLTLETLKNELASQISNMTSEEIFELNNTFCIEANYHDDMIYLLDDDSINEEFYGKSPMEIIKITSYGDFNYGHDYYRYDGYGNLESLSYLDETHLPDFVGNVVEFIIENADAFGHIFDGLEELIEIATQNEEA